MIYNFFKFIFIDIYYLKYIFIYLLREIIK